MMTGTCSWTLNDASEGNGDVTRATVDTAKGTAGLDITWNGKQAYRILLTRQPGGLWDGKGSGAVVQNGSLLKLAGGGYQFEATWIEGPRYGFEAVFD